MALQKNGLTVLGLANAQPSMHIQCFDFMKFSDLTLLYLLMYLPTYHANG